MATPTNDLDITQAGLVKFDGTATFTGVTVTQFDVLVGAASNGISSVGPGTTGQVLQSGGNAADPAYSTATYPSTAGTSGYVITSDGTNFNVAPAPGGAATDPVYGDGSDGTQTFDGSTTILGIVPSVNTYTLSRDIYLSSSTINNGVSIIANGYRLFCNGTLTNNGTIQWNGGNGSGSSAGANVTNTSSPVNSNNTTSNGPSTPGGAGSTGAGTHGVNSAFAGGTSSPISYGGVGGTGGTGVSGGGVGGTLSSPPASSPQVRTFPFNLGFLIGGTGITFLMQGGTGGGGGGGDGVNNGGGGGGGGAFVLVYARIFAGTGNIQALGGNGGNGTAGTTGGGGGGGGGLVVVVSQSVSGGAISGQTISAGGGTGGIGFGIGTSGATGNTGTTIISNL